MSSLMIRDLAGSREIDQAAMATVRGGRAWLAGAGAFANVNVGVEQNIIQFQDIEINALNNVGVIGAGFGPLALNVSPKQSANLRAVL